MATIGQLLRKARESTGLTQVEFAKKSKVKLKVLAPRKFLFTTKLGSRKKPLLGLPC